MLYYDQIALYIDGFNTFLFRISPFMCFKLKCPGFPSKMSGILGSHLLEALQFDQIKETIMSTPFKIVEGEKH